VIKLHHGNVLFLSVLEENKLLCELHLLLKVKSLALKVIISDYMVVIFKKKIVLNVSFYIRETD